MNINQYKEYLFKLLQFSNPKVIYSNNEYILFSWTSHIKYYGVILKELKLNVAFTLDLNNNYRGKSFWFKVTDRETMGWSYLNNRSNDFKKFMKIYNSDEFQDQLLIEEL